MLAQLTKRTRFLAAAAVLVLGLTATAARADDAALYAQTLKATAWIQTPAGGHGTGWLLDSDKRLVVTNKHVVGDSETVTVMFAMVKNGQVVTAASEYLKEQGTLAIKGKVLSRDAKRDLALIELERLPDHVVALTLAQNSARMDEALLSIGNSGLAGQPIAQGTLWKMRTGKVTTKSFRMLYYNNVNQHLETSMLNTTVGTSGGDSGGPVVNQRGELVAVTSGGNILTKESFAVDVTELRDFLANALDGSRRPRGEAQVLTGAWTTTWSNNGSKLFASIKLQPDGTLQYEDDRGTVYEGAFRVSNDGLSLSLPGMGLDATSDMNWYDSDSFRIMANGIEYKLVRR